MAPSLHLSGKVFQFAPPGHPIVARAGKMYIDPGLEIEEGWNQNGAVRGTTLDGAYLRGRGRRFVLSAAATAKAKPRAGMRPVVAAMRIVWRAFLPSLALAGIVLTTWTLVDVRFLGLDPYLTWSQGGLIPGHWLSWGYLLVPVGFFAIQLPSRRAGLDIALIQILLAWTFLNVAAAVIYFAAPHLLSSLPAWEMRSVLSFGVALFLSQIVTALVFDGMRCIRWWQAPLMSGLWGSLAFVLLFYPAAFLGLDSPWLGYCVIHFGTLVTISLLLLIPYWILRPFIRPLPGYAGY